MKRLSFGMMLAALCLLLASAGAQAQGQGQGQGQDQAANASHNGESSQATTTAGQNQANEGEATLAEWEYNSIYNAGGIRAEYMITEEVFDAQGNEIGNVENAIISAGGQIVALIIEVGGFWDITPTNIVVPWKQVTLIPDGFKVPITRDNYDDYLLFGDQSFVTMESLQQIHPVNAVVATGAQTWKLGALLDDYVVLEGGIGYGYLDDVLFSKDGEIQALIVRSSIAAYGFGVYAFPYYGYRYGWQPYDSIYTLPYGPAAIETLAPFDYGMYEAYWQ